MEGHGRPVDGTGSGKTPRVPGTMGLYRSGMGSVRGGERPAGSRMPLRASNTERGGRMERMGRGGLDATHPHGTTSGSLDVRSPSCRSRGEKIRKHVQEPMARPEMAGADACCMEKVLGAVEKDCTEDGHNGSDSGSGGDDARR